MGFAICPQSVVPVRVQANHQSELLSQLLFGELAEIVDKKGKGWLKIRSIADNNFGWVASNQLTPISDNEFESLKINFAFALDVSKSIRGKNNHFPVPIGARFRNFDGLRFKLSDQVFEYSGQAVFPDELKRNSTELLPKIARKFLFSPEMKGGRSPFGIDSAALVQLIFSFIGIEIPRKADQQIESGKSIDFSEEAAEGDLAFFENRKGKITHVGLILSGHTIIHSHGNVRIDKIDHFGIFDESTSKYSHKLRLIKRLLPDPEPIEKIEKPTNGVEVDQKILF